MLKIKRNKYLYAQLKINGKVTDFYIGLFSDISSLKNTELYDVSKKIENNIENILDGTGVKWKSHGFSTVYGRFIEDLSKLEEKIKAVGAD